MTVLLIAVAVIGVVAAAWLVLAVWAGIAERRRQRRRALQRALVMQAADQRMRSVSRSAVRAMLNELVQRQGHSR